MDQTLRIALPVPNPRVNTKAYRTPTRTINPGPDPTDITNPTREVTRPKLDPSLKNATDDEAKNAIRKLMPILFKSFRLNPNPMIAPKIHMPHHGPSQLAKKANVKIK
jgi:hypothetical protein